MVNKVFGRLKHLPEDFIVEEQADKWNCSVSEKFIPNKSPDMKSLELGEVKDFVWCEMEKRDIDHFHAVKEVLKQLRLSVKSFGYAGTKDRVAWTSQRVSLYKPDLGRIKSFSHERIFLKDLKWAKRKIRLGYLQGNKFILTIRDVEKKDAMKVVNDIRKMSFFPNFFGAQRFGSIRGNNVEVGKLILKRDFKKAVETILMQDSPNERIDIRKARKKLRETKDYRAALEFFPHYLRLEQQILRHLSKFPDDFVGALRFGDRKNVLMFVNAVQSKIFNEILQAALDEGLSFTRKGHENCILVGYKTNFYDGRLGDIEQEILKAHNLTREDFDVRELPFLRIKGSYRKAVTEVKDLVVQVEDDEIFSGSRKILLEFTLPSGVYATTFLENFFDFD